jgi:hypothetical protein
VATLAAVGCVLNRECAAAAVCGVVRVVWVANELDCVHDDVACGAEAFARVETEATVGAMGP